MELGELSEPLYTSTPADVTDPLRFFEGLVPRLGCDVAVCIVSILNLGKNPPVNTVTVAISKIPKRRDFIASAGASTNCRSVYC